MLNSEGDIAGALLAASPHHDSIDILMGTGGVPEGVIAACAVKAMGGAILGRLAPQGDKEQAMVTEAGLDTQQILQSEELISSNQIFFAATGITDGPLLAGVRYRGNMAETETLLIRGATGTRRIIQTEHLIE